MTQQTLTTERGTFDRRGFAQAIEMTRRVRNLTWCEVAEQSGVSQPTLSRMTRGLHLGATTLAALVAWAALDANNFIGGGGVRACQLCGQPGPGIGSHKSPIDCVMALRARVAELEREQYIDLS